MSWRTQGEFCLRHSERLTAKELGLLVDRRTWRGPLTVHLFNRRIAMAKPEERDFDGIRFCGAARRRESWLPKFAQDDKCKFLPDNGHAVPANQERP
jgi:hypothetical protein